MNISFERKLLARIPPSAQLGAVLFAPDGRAVAFSVGEHDFIHQGGPMHVVTEGKHHPAYHEVGSLTLGRDGRTLAYVARTDEKWLVVRNGKAGERFDYVSDLVFHDEVAYVASVGGRWTSTYGDTELSGYVSGVASQYSGGTWLVVAGDRRGPAFEEVERPVFSLDGKRLAYKGRRGSKSFIVLDGQVGVLHDDVLCTVYSAPVFSANSELLAYVAMDGGQQHVFVGANRLRACDAVSALQFTPRGETAFVAQEEGRQKVIIGARESAAYDSIHDLIFDPEGKHEAFVARRGSDREYVRGASKSFVVCDGRPREEFDDINLYSLRFVRDTGDVVFVAKVRGKSVVVSPNGQSEAWDSILFPTSSGRTTAFAAQAGEKWYVVAGATRSGPYERVCTRPLFSPDGTKLAFGCQRGGELYWDVVEVVTP